MRWIGSGDGREGKKEFEAQLPEYREESKTGKEDVSLGRTPEDANLEVDLSTLCEAWKIDFHLGNPWILSNSRITVTEAGVSGGPEAFPPMQDPPESSPGQSHLLKVNMPAMRVASQGWPKVSHSLKQRGFFLKLSPSVLNSELRLYFQEALQ